MLFIYCESVFFSLMDQAGRLKQCVGETKLVVILSFISSTFEL